MCTVTLLPVPGGGYLLGTNRDESPRRGPAIAPAIDSSGARRALMPRDSDAGGTWVLVDDDGRCLCILNGDRPAVSPPLEAPSRGNLLLELAGHPSPAHMFAELVRRHAAGSLTQRAFKLLVVEAGTDATPASATLIEWNGLDTPTARALQLPCVLVSSSFDPEGAARDRGAAFASLAAQPSADPEALAQAQFRWHAAHSEPEPDGGTRTVCMHRKEASTVSFTAVHVDAGSARMAYHDGPPCVGRPMLRRSLERRA